MTRGRPRNLSGEARAAAPFVSIELPRINTRWRRVLSDRPALSVVVVDWVARPDLVIVSYRHIGALDERAFAPLHDFLSWFAPDNEPLGAAALADATGAGL